MKRKLITMIIICSLLVSFSINVLSNNKIENSKKTIPSQKHTFGRTAKRNTR